MPSVEWNSNYWGGGYDWPESGEEWSKAWGGSRAQWLYTLFPRISRWLPATSICEIATGYGRWTEYLIPLAGKYTGIDLSPACVQGCRERFSAAENAAFGVTDGRTISGVDDESVDLVFSFDSLVHCERDVMAAYVQECLRVLKPGGVAFLHHSNWAALAREEPNKHCRGESVSGQTLAIDVQDCGGAVLVQECVNWGKVDLLDCISTFTKPSGRNNEVFATPRLIENRTFMLEAEICRTAFSAYTR